jgi:PAS domain-containing protein
MHSDTVHAATAGGQVLHVSRSIGLLAGRSEATPAHALVMMVRPEQRANRRAENQRKALLAELQATLEATADGILVTDATPAASWRCNRRFAELWGMPPEHAAAARRRRRAGLDARSVTEPEAYAQPPAGAAIEARC